MTPQEQQMIQGLIDRVQQTQLPEKDSQAEQLLQQSLGRNPDALYILAQTVLVQKYALDQAQKQLADLKSQLDQAHQQQTQPKHTSFLGSLLGRDDTPTAPPPPPQLRPQQQGYAPVPGYSPQGGQQAPPQYAAPAYAPQPGAGSFAAPQGGGFLRSALQTATGVAAGALAFEGIESLMHGFGGGGGGFGGGQGFGNFGGGGGAPREEIINNYYGDSDRGDSNLSPDVEDRRDDNSRQFDGDTGSDQFTNSDDSDTNATDLSGGDSSLDAGSDDSSFDSGNTSSFDSGGGDDSSFS